MLPAPVTVYAVSQVYPDGYGYAAGRAIAPDYGYTVEVPPGYYTVVARIDGDPSTVAGYSTVACTPGVNCNPDDGLTRVRVDSDQTVGGIDVGSWGSGGALSMSWNIDLYASPLDTTAYAHTPSPHPTRAMRYRPISGSGALPLPQTFDTGINVLLRVPDGWHEIDAPIPSRFATVRYFASQGVRSPAELSKGGTWLILAARLPPCNATPPYWFSSYGEIFPPSQPAAYFYFQEPYDQASHEPLLGYKFMGEGTFAGGGCLGFNFATDSDQSREANLATFASIAEHAEYRRPAA